MSKMNRRIIFGSQGWLAWLFV